MLFYPVQDEVEDVPGAREEDDLEQVTELLVIPGDLEGSVLWDALAGTTLTRMMPPSGRLPGDEVQHVADWILAGAEME